MLPPIDLLVIGDAMVDITIRPTGIHPGGALPSQMAIAPGGLANVAVAARKAGVETGFLGRIGRDPFGDFYEQDLAKNEVVSYAKRSGLATGLCVNLISPGGERTMYTSRGANEMLTVQDLEDEILNTTRMIFVSGFAMETPASATVLEQICSMAKSMNKPIAIGGGAHNLIARRPRRFAQLVRDYADHLVLNEKEAAALTGHEEREMILRRLARMTDFFVMTQGSRGSHSYINGVHGENPCPHVRPVDTTGSGDAFTGVLLAGILKGESPEEAIAAAHRVASLKARQLGPR